MTTVITAINILISIMMLTNNKFLDGFTAMA